MQAEELNRLNELIGEAARLVKDQLVRSLQELSRLTPVEAVQSRYEKFRKMGNFFFVGA